MNHLSHYINLLEQSLTGNTFVKLSLANYKGSEEDLKNCYVKRVQIKQENKLSFTYRYKTRDIVKNFSIQEGITTIAGFLENGDFKHSTLFTLDNDIVFESVSKDKTLLKKNPPSQKELQSLQHNEEKKRWIKAEGKHYLHELNITDEKGNVHKNSQDKFKQINHYIDLLSPLIKNLPRRDVLKVVDMGAGKGYLTFALYDYLSNVINTTSKVTGIEFRNDLVELCNGIAKNSQFANLNFVKGSIIDFEDKDVNVLIALHACDTATDDAICKGINANADLIVVAPCCHKQIRRELEQHKRKNDLDFLIKHGIFMERHAEMLTDGLRALILEYFDYTTKVVEFIDGQHTPKNVMIIAEKKIKTAEQKQEILKKINETKTYFGIASHYLEKLIGI